ncbi:uncharacterized protein ACBT44_000836 isoform 1-T2 [Syngnathus typhle]
MAPIPMFDMMSSFSSAEAGIISLVIFLILSISLVALCTICQKSSSTAYDVNGGGTATDGRDSNYTAWRDHKSMPKSTLERSVNAVS